MSVFHHIGLEIAERSFRFVEIQQQDRQSTILRADTVETAHDYASPLLFDIPFDRNLARDFITDLASVYHRHTVYAESLSLVLPAELPVVATVPLDASLRDDERRDQLQWECTALGGFQKGTPLRILSHTLDGESQSEQVLCVALPQATVDFLSQTCRYLTLTLSAIDIDHFVLENAIQKLYPHDTAASYAVVGLYEDHCSAGRYHGDRYFGYRMASVSYKQHYAAQAVRLLESLPGTAAAPPLEQVFVFGDRTEDPIADALETILKCPVTRCIPLADTVIPDAVREGFDRSGEALFDAAASAALLGLP